ncbi:unnamed protein product [Ectocarpus sp. 4 AP-2014]
MNTPSEEPVDLDHASFRQQGSLQRLYVEREATAKGVWSGFAPVGKNSAMVLGLTRQRLYSTSSRTSTKTTSRRRRKQLLLFHASPRRTKWQMDLRVRERSRVRSHPAGRSACAAAARLQSHEVNHLLAKPSSFEAWTRVSDDPDTLALAKSMSDYIG